MESYFLVLIQNGPRAGEMVATNGTTERDAVIAANAAGNAIDITGANMAYIPAPVTNAPVVAPPPLTGLTITGGDTAVAVGVDTPAFFAAPVPAGATLPAITWASSDATILTVDATSGIATGVLAGTAHVTASGGGFTADSPDITVS